MRLSLPSMYDLVIAMLAQGQLHINPPIKVIGSCEDLWFRNLKTHNCSGGSTAKLHTSYVAPVNFTAITH